MNSILLTSKNRRPTSAKVSLNDMRCPSFSVSTRTPSQSKSNAAGRGSDDDDDDDEEEQTTAFRPLGATNTLPHPVFLREEEEDGLLPLPLRNLGTGKEAWSGAKEKVFFGTRDEEATDEAEAAAAAAIEIWWRYLVCRGFRNGLSTAIKAYPTARHKPFIYSILTIFVSQ